MELLENENYGELNFSEIYRKNRRFSIFLIGGLGSAMCSLIFFKILLIDFVEYSSPYIEPVLFFLSAISTCLCLNGWLLSAGGKILLSMLSLAYPLFPIVCRSVAPSLIENEIVALDEFLSDGLSLTLIALFSTITYSVIFQSYQLYFARMLVQNPQLVISWLEKEVTPYEKRQPKNLHLINRTIKLTRFLKSKKGRSNRLALILFRDKLKTTISLQPKVSHEEVPQKN